MSKKKIVPPYEKPADISVPAIDTHMHFNRDGINPAEIVENMQADGLKKIIVVATSQEDIADALPFVKNNPNVYLAAGIHPYDCDKFTPEFKNLIVTLHKSLGKKFVAVGEIGLDFSRSENPSAEEQTRVLVEQLELASELNLPVILHLRDAHDLAKKVLAANKNLFAKRGGVVHCFSGTKQDAEDYLALGLHLSFTGCITYEKKTESNPYIEIIRPLPMDKFFIETDSPFLSPAPYRGTENSPKMVLLVAEKIAEIKGISANAVISQTNKNAEEFFRLN